MPILPNRMIGWKRSGALVTQGFVDWLNDALGSTPRKIRGESGIECVEEAPGWWVIRPDAEDSGLSGGCGAPVTVLVGPLAATCNSDGTITVTAGTAVVTPCQEGV